MGMPAALRFYHRLSLLLILLAIPVNLQTRLDAQRLKKIQIQKVGLSVRIKSLSLSWNADQGEGGRGDGEVYISIRVHWPTDPGEIEGVSNISKKEGIRTQGGEYGPLNGDVEFPTGVIRQNPETDQWEVVPVAVVDTQFLRLRAHLGSGLGVRPRFHR